MKPDKRKAFSDAEKAALLKSYQSSGKMKKQWCKENAIGLSTLHRWLRQEKNTITPQPLQCWVPVISAVPEKSKAFEMREFHNSRVKQPAATVNHFCLCEKCNSSIKNGFTHSVIGING